MKTEREIRAFRDDLRAVARKTHELMDCHCLVCQSRALMSLRDVEEKINTLSWVLGECGDGDLIVERAAAMARRRST